MARLTMQVSYDTATNILTVNGKSQRCHISLIGNELQNEIRRQKDKTMIDNAFAQAFAGFK